MAFPGFHLPISFPEKYKRLITAAVLLLILAFCLAMGGWPLRLLVLIASLLGLYEFYSLFLPGRQGLPLKAAGLACAAVVVAGQAFGPLWSGIGVAAAFWASGLFFLFSYGRGNAEARFQNYAPLSLGVVYIPFVLQMALYLSLEEQILVMGAAILTDTGGYAVGMRFGKHKVWPLISPKKSWEGSLGGMACCILFCMLAGVLAQMKGLNLPLLPLGAWAAIGVVLNVAAQFGDFFESALKRTLGVKDSGALLPGHGGLLDRIDSVLFVLPVYMIIHYLTRYPGTV